MDRATEHKEKIKEGNQKAQLQNLSKELIVVTEALSLKVKELSETDEKITSLKNEGVSLLLQLEDLKNKYNDVSADIVQAKTKEARLNREVRVAEEKVEKEQRKHQGTINTLLDQIKDLGHSIETKNAQLLVQEEKLRIAEEALVTLKEHIAEQQLSLQVLTLKLLAYEESCSHRCVELDKLISEKEAEYAKLCRLCKARNEEYSRYHDKLEERIRAVTIREKDAAIWTRRIQNVARGTFPTTAYIIL